MSYNLFIDDERNPEDVTWAPRNTGYEHRRWVIARSFSDAVTIIRGYGVPNFVSFDHDLGENQLTGHDITKQLVGWDTYGGGPSIPADFSFFVHSQNPVGKANIEGLLNNYLEFKKNNA